MAQDAWELAAPLAAQRLALDFVRACDYPIKRTTVIPLTNISVPPLMNVTLAEAQSGQGKLDFEIVEADLVDKVAPALGFAG